MCAKTSPHLQLRSCIDRSRCLTWKADGNVGLGEDEELVCEFPSRPGSITHQIQNFHGDRSASRHAVDKPGDGSDVGGREGGGEVRSES